MKRLLSSLLISFALTTAAHGEETIVEIAAIQESGKISPHFTIDDFVPAGDRASGARIQSSLVAKLELIIERLQEKGYACDGLRILSAYRSPSYNRSIGNRTRDSRHQYGDAADVLAEDFNRDGRIDARDNHILFTVVDELDRAGLYPGGASKYAATRSHGPFVHVDTRGTIIRW